MDNFNQFCTGPMMQPPLLLLKSSMVRASSCLVEVDEVASLGYTPQVGNLSHLGKFKYMCTVKLTSKITIQFPQL